MRNADLAILAAILCVAFGITAAMLFHPSQADGIRPERFRDAPMEQEFEPPKAEQQAAQEIEADQEPDSEPGPTYEQAYEPVYGPIETFSEPVGTYYADYDSAYNTNGPSHEMPGWYDGYLETYYDASAHYLASTWTLDDEGFFHDENGRYVVGVDINDVNPETGQGYQYGDVVDTGKGEGVVYDFGYGAHVHDFAVSGW